MIVKIGPKKKHLEIPAGWKLVTSGVIMSHDQFANVGEPNKPFWQIVDTDDVDDPVIWFEAVIRRD